MISGKARELHSVFELPAKAWSPAYSSSICDMLAYLGTQARANAAKLHSIPVLL